jgi:transaldolase
MTQSPFLYMKENSKTVLWNDSADPKELKDALTWGIVGATCNPVIALSAIKADKDYWVGRIKEYAKNHPAATDDQIGWAMVEELSINAAKIFEAEFEINSDRPTKLSRCQSADRSSGGFFKTCKEHHCKDPCNF